MNKDEVLGNFYIKHTMCLWLRVVVENELFTAFCNFWQSKKNVMCMGKVQERG
jgi:hypothetical protein